MPLKLRSRVSVLESNTEGKRQYQRMQVEQWLNNYHTKIDSLECEYTSRTLALGMIGRRSSGHMITGTNSIMEGTRERSKSKSYASSEKARYGSSAYGSRHVAHRLRRAQPAHDVIDKPMRGHGLMQAIARVNSVFKDKPGGPDDCRTSSPFPNTSRHLEPPGQPENPSSAAHQRVRMTSSPASPVNRPGPSGISVLRRGGSAGRIGTQAPTSAIARRPRQSDLIGLDIRTSPVCRPCRPRCRRRSARHRDRANTTSPDCRARCHSLRSSARWRRRPSSRCRQRSRSRASG